MMRRPLRRALSALTATAAILALGVQLVAAVGLWTLGVSPVTAVAGTNTTFTFTATSLDAALGMKCFVIEVPGAIAPGDTWVTGSSTTASWSATRSGHLVSISIFSGDGNDKLLAGGWVGFAVNGVPTAAGTYAFSGVAYSNHGCSENPRALSVPAVVTVSGSIIVPTPPPPPPPTPTPTPTPKPVIVVPTLPPSLPVVQPTPRPQPTQPPAAPTPRPADNPPPAAAESRPPDAAPPSASAAAVAPPATPAAASENRAEAAVLAVARADPGGPDAADVSLGTAGLMGGLGVWGVPGAVISGPGLIVIAWVVFQATVAAAWVPAVKRLRGGEGRPGWPGGRATPQA